jgi:hypothetical protein
LYDVGTEVYGPSSAYDNSTTMGMYLPQAQGAIAGLTVHTYPLRGNCNATDYLNAYTAVAATGISLGQIAAMRNAVNGEYGTPLVLEETAGSYGGGCENITDRFLGGFFWVNTVGTVASSGFDKVHRQDLAGWSFTGRPSKYQLAGPSGWPNGQTGANASAALTPHPDWYSSVLFKTLVGSVILNGSVTAVPGTDPNLLQAVTLHTWCSGTPASYNNSIVISYTNPTGSDVNLTLGVLGIPSVPRTEYVLTGDAPSYQDSPLGAEPRGSINLRTGVEPNWAALQSDAVFLNGQQWSVNGQGVLPALPVRGRTVNDPSQGVLVMPAYSYGFFQFYGQAPAACRP